MSDAFRADIDKWLIDFFGYEEVKPTMNDANLVTKKHKKKQYTKTLGSLLENIDKTFKALEFDIDEVSFYRILKSEVIGLKKCAPLITDNNFMLSEHVLDKVDVSKGLPGYFVIAVNQGDGSKVDALLPDFAFGLKVKKVPWCVTRLPGVVYLFGMAWRDGKKHIWNGFWLSVLPDGSIKVADELKTNWVKVGKEYFTQRVWDKSSWSHSPTDKESAIRHCFCETLRRYQTRNESWNISVSNGKKRIVFLIPDNEAKEYFKDRSKVMTSSGKTKPIIHFVHAHTQHRSDKIVNVPEHIRGLREFDWSGYHCTVTAPEFHAFITSMYDLAGESVLGDELPEGHLGLSEVADMMNSFEDAGRKRRKTVQQDSQK